MSPYAGDQHYEDAPTPSEVGGELPEPGPQWAWQVFDVDHRWGIVAAVIPSMGSAAVPLITRSQHVAEQMRPLAEAHAKATGLTVRLHRFDFTEDVTDE